MAFKHGKSTFISIDGDDLSQFVKKSDLDRTADSHDLTTYGRDDHVYEGGLGDGSCSIEGWYATGATGPRAVLEPLVGSVVVLIRRPEGTGTTLPQVSVNVLIKSYKESAPVADFISWSADLQLSGPITDTPQA